jgi:hypothetical protein
MMAYSALPILGRLFEKNHAASSWDNGSQKLLPLSLDFIHDILLYGRSRKQEIVMK